MMYLGSNAVGLNSFISKNIPSKWDIVEFTPTSTSTTYVINHTLGVTPDIFMIVPESYDDSTTGQGNPMMIFGTNGTFDSSNKYRTVLNYLNSSGNWDYTANSTNIYCEKDNEKVTIYIYNGVGIKANNKYYVIVIAFDKGVT